MLSADHPFQSDFGLPPGQRVLVVAPHPDDELLGCGGLAALLARKGASFYAVFVTDGGASHRGSRTWDRARLTSCREAEAIEALRRLDLGTASRNFLRLSDAAMPPQDSDDWKFAYEKLLAIVRDFQPDLALLPWRRDPHCDHRDSWHLAKSALKGAGVYPFVLEYSIWLDELGTEEDHPRPGEAHAVYIDVASAVPQKKAAIAAHRSQTTTLINDDPNGFRLSATTIARLTGRTEKYWRPLDETN